MVINNNMLEIISLIVWVSLLTKIVKVSSALIVGRRKIIWMGILEYLTKPTKISLVRARI
jgi:hypothetical protein